MTTRKFNQPLGGNEMPRFGGPATMMRLPTQPNRLMHPAFVIWGDADFQHIKDRSRLIANTLSGARHLVMEECAHLPNMEQPTQFDEAVLEFLTGLP